MDVEPKANSKPAKAADVDFRSVLLKHDLRSPSRSEYFISELSMLNSRGDVFLSLTRCRRLCQPAEPGPIGPIKPADPRAAAGCREPCRTVRGTRSCTSLTRPMGPPQTRGFRPRPSTVLWMSLTWINRINGNP